MTRVLVTGAGGFIGQALVKDLAAADCGVLALVRRPATFGGAIQTQLVEEMDQLIERHDVFDGIDIVVHLAARVHRADETSRDLTERYTQANATATRRLALAAAGADVKRFIYLSTVKVHGGEGERPCAEDDPPEPDDPYSVSKMYAERALAKVREDTGLATVTLRPPLVYGSGVKANFRTLLRLADTPLPLPLGGIGHNARSYIYLGNLLSAIRVVMTAPEAVGQTYLVRDGEDVSTAELVTRLRAALGRKRRLLSVPVPMLSAAASILGKSSIIEPLAGSRRIDDSRIRRELGWQPPYTLDQGLAATAAWYRASRGP